MDKTSYTVIITRQNNGQYYGKIVALEDSNGNEVSCLRNNPTECLKDLAEQLYELENPRQFKLF